MVTRIGLDLVRSKKETILFAKESVHKEDIPSQVGKDAFSGRDLLSRLLAANMATDLPGSQRLSDHDLYSRMASILSFVRFTFLNSNLEIPTFLLAGHETTATAATWTLFALGQDLSIQNKLREELLSVETETPSMDELNALPYLESVVRETMRLHAPVSSTFRISAKDDLIPLEKPYQDQSGILRHEIPSVFLFFFSFLVVIKLLLYSISKGGEMTSDFTHEQII